MIWATSAARCSMVSPAPLVPSDSFPNYLFALLFITIAALACWFDYTKMRGSLSSGQQVEFVKRHRCLYHAMLPIFVYVVTSIGG